jgi:serine/threonine protein kinase
MMDPTTDAEDSADDPRLIRATQEYLAELEAGRRPQRTAFVARFPDLADQLTPFLDALDMVHGASPLLNSSTGRRPAADSLPVEPLGDFRIEREIGRGGMGVVYEAIQMSLGRRVALKVLPFAAALDSKQLQRFQNEAQAAAQLHHTNIVPVYAVGSERGVHYYAMQLIEGQNLADLIAHLRSKEPVASLPSTGPVDAPADASPAAATLTGAAAHLSTQRASRSSGFYRTAARLAAQAAEALEHAHQVGVIHRDVKPANLMVDHRGNLWVTDFGLAQFHNRVGLTRTGDLLGTLRYMSPEQAAGQGTPLDHRTDIYSLGATLYELLTLEPMFGGTDHGRLLREILYDEPRKLRSVERSVPPELETIVLKAVSKSPSDRYSTAQEFADDLHRFLDNKPIRARRPTLAQRGRKWAQRHPSFLIWAAVVLCLLFAGSGVANWLLQQEKKNTEIAYQNEKKRKEEAEQHLKIARNAVDEMIQVSEEELLDKPGMGELRNRLLFSALKYYQQFIEQSEDDPRAQAELAATKERVEKILNDLAALEGSGQFMHLNRDDVLKDLEANDEQKKQLVRLLWDIDRQWFATFAGFFNLSPEEQRQRFLRRVELANTKEARVKEILSAGQLHRLKQIDLQLRGAGAFHDPEVVAALKLTADQKESIRSIEKDSFCPPGFGRGLGKPESHKEPGAPGKPDGRGGPGGLGKPGGPIFGGPGGRGWEDHGRRGPGESKPDPDSAARNSVARIVKEVLTPQQTATWEKLIGKHFAGPMFFPFGPRPGLPSGPGGAPPDGRGGPPPEGRPPA